MHERASERLSFSIMLFASAIRSTAALSPITFFFIFEPSRKRGHLGYKQLKNLGTAKSNCLPSTMTVLCIVLVTRAETDGISNVRDMWALVDLWQMGYGIRDVRWDLFALCAWDIATLVEMCSCTKMEFSQPTNILLPSLPFYPTY